MKNMFNIKRIKKTINLLINCKNIIYNSSEVIEIRCCDVTYVSFRALAVIVFEINVICIVCSRP